MAGSPDLPSYLQHLHSDDAQEQPLPAAPALGKEPPQADAPPQPHVAVVLQTSDVPPPPVKRGRGRPRKHPLPSEIQGPKRGPGRPRKQPNPQSSAGETALPPSSADPSSSKRGPGRPRKQAHPQTAMDQAPPPPPPGGALAGPSAAVDSIGAYHSDSAVEVKKRGRPPKNTASLTMLSETAGAPAGLPKKRGRPRKNPLPESSLAPYRDEQAEGLLLLLPEPPRPDKRGPGRPRKNPDDPNRPAKKPKHMSAANLEKWRKGLASWRASLTKMMRDLEAAEAAYQQAAAAESGAAGTSGAAE